MYVPLRGLLYLAHSFLSLLSPILKFSFQAKNKSYTLRPHGAAQGVRRVEKGSQPLHPPEAAAITEKGVLPPDAIAEALSQR